MVKTFSVAPGDSLEESVVEITDGEYLPYIMAHIGRGTYCWTTTVDTAFEAECKLGRLNSNYQG